VPLDVAPRLERVSELPPISDFRPQVTRLDVRFVTISLEMSHGRFTDVEFILKVPVPQSREPNWSVVPDTDVERADSGERHV
jgi:hypothetical protein